MSDATSHQQRTLTTQQKEGIMNFLLSLLGPFKQCQANFQNISNKYEVPQYIIHTSVVIAALIASIILPFGWSSFGAWIGGMIYAAIGLTPGGAANIVVSIAASILAGVNIASGITNFGISLHRRITYGCWDYSLSSKKLAEIQACLVDNCEKFSIAANKANDFFSSLYIRNIINTCFQAYENPPGREAATKETCEEILKKFVHGDPVGGYFKYLGFEHSLREREQHIREYLNLMDILAQDNKIKGEFNINNFNTNSLSAKSVDVLNTSKTAETLAKVAYPGQSQIKIITPVVKKSLHHGIHKTPQNVQVKKHSTKTPTLSTISDQQQKPTTKQAPRLSRKSGLNFSAQETITIGKQAISTIGLFDSLLKTDSYAKLKNESTSISKLLATHSTISAKSSLQETLPTVSAFSCSSSDSYDVEKGVPITTGFNSRRSSSTSSKEKIEQDEENGKEKDNLDEKAHYNKAKKVANL